MNFSRSHIACTDNCINLIRSNHFPILCRYFRSTVRDMEITHHEYQHSHLLLFRHFCFFCCIFYYQQIDRYQFRFVKLWLFWVGFWLLVNRQRLVFVLNQKTRCFCFNFGGLCIILNQFGVFLWAFSHNRYILINCIQMKSIEKADSKKKQKPTLIKASSTATLVKKSQPKKPLSAKKQESSVPPVKRTQLKTPLVHSTNNSNSKSSSANSTGVRSSKFALQSLRTSPKSSLGQINSIHVKKLSQQSKTKLDIYKTPSKVQDPALKKVKQQVKKSLANVIKVYHPQKQSYLDISMTQVTHDGQMKEDKLMKTDFNFLNVIGEGGYGKVWKVQHHKTRVVYAMKEMSKALIIMKKSAENVLNQMKILSKLKNQFIANMSFAFNDRDNLYLGMDYLPGGDLRSFLGESEKLTQQQAKFLIACIIKSIEYIHANKIFHRDIKPENLVLDEKGYLRLTDFGIARSQRQKQLLDASGTPGYMAPEVLNKQVHSFPVDFYAVGIIAHELMIGKRPYTGQNRNEIRDAIISKQHSIKKKDIPPKWSVQSADFINKLIIRQPKNRLGSKSGIQQLKQHPWFAKFPWKQLEQKKITSPFKPKYNGPTATDRLDEYEEAVNQYKLLQRADQKVDIFGGYYCNFR